MEQRQDLFRYVVEEFHEDYTGGEIPRHEFLRRMLLLGGGIVGANVLIDSLGLNAVSAAEWQQVIDTPATLEQAQTGPQVSETDPACPLCAPLWHPADAFLDCRSGRPCSRDNHDHIQPADIHSRDDPCW